MTMNRIKLFGIMSRMLFLPSDFFHLVQIEMMKLFLEFQSEFKFSKSSEGHYR